MWPNLAAVKGEEATIVVRDSVEKYMSAEQIAEAQKPARKWKSK
jgi:hypothetical protein